MARGRPRPTLPLVDPSRLRPLVPPWSDVVLAGGFLTVSLAQVAVEPIAGPVTSVVVAVGSAAPVAWRRAAPATAALAGTAIWLVPTPQGFLFLGFVMAVVLFFSLGAYGRDLGRVLLTTGFGVTVGVVVVLTGPQHPATAAGAALAVAGPAVAGRLGGHARAQSARLEALTAELVQERAAAERRAVAEERTRIARELHDVIGHEVSVIALQADAAAAALDKAPERAAVPVATIRSAAAAALAEMRRVVGLLREDGDDERHPQPGLADLVDLVAAARSSGTDVELALHPPRGPLPPGLQLTVYRVVQEALTNARRHSPGSAVRVRVEPGRDALCVEVTSTGGRSARSPGGGHGLIGITERAAACGGSAQFGPRGGAGGFRVSARLPA